MKNFSRPYNFGPGPSQMPVSVLKRVSEEMMNWRNSGMSVMELPHRGKLFEKLLDETLELGTNLLGLPDSHNLIFMQGGARGQNAIIPLNILNENDVCDYLITGFWSKLSADEATKYGKVNIVAEVTSQPKSIPSVNDWSLSNNASYLHFCANETVDGIEFHDWPNLLIDRKVNTPLIVDVSSNIFTRRLNFKKTIIAYAGAQKNIGPAGLTLVIIDKNFVESLQNKKQNKCPNVFNYKNVLNSKSCFNTPPTFAIFVTKIMFEWILESGGVSQMEETNKKKSSLIYEVIDTSSIYESNVSKECRSFVNIPFFIKKPNLTALFLNGAEERGLINLKGHSSVGGLRASIYNSMPMAGVEKLVDWLNKFEKQYS